MVVRNGRPAEGEVSQDSSYRVLVAELISQLHQLLLFTAQERKQCRPDTDTCAYLKGKLDQITLTHLFSYINYN